MDLEIMKKMEEQADHDSNKMMGEIVRNLGIKIAKQNLFMDDITREELK